MPAIQKPALKNVHRLKAAHKKGPLVPVKAIRGPGLQVQIQTRILLALIDAHVVYLQSRIPEFVQIILRVKAIV